MCLKLILPQVKPTEFKLPGEYPYPDCEGLHLEHHQRAEKALQDTQ